MTGPSQIPPGCTPVTLLVSSCDAFSDCWPALFHGFRKYWPDRAYPLRLITNFKDPNDDAVSAIKVGEDRGWAQNLLVALEQIDSPFLLYAQEDYWLTRPVESRTLEQYLHLLVVGRADYIRLFPCPVPDGPVLAQDPRLGVLGDQAPYRASLQMAFWRKDVLQQLVRPDESQWEFEHHGSIRSRPLRDRFLSVRAFWEPGRPPYHHGVDYVCTAVVKGKWARAAREYSRREGVPLSLAHRPLESYWDTFSRENRAGRLLARLLSVAREPRRVLRRLTRGRHLAGY